MPARVLLQDFTGVPSIVDLAAMRDGMVELGGDPSLIEPGIPVDLVCDHSINVDISGVADAFPRNAALEFERNRERYTFLRWAQSAFKTLRVFPPNRGICHQVNLEYLANVVFRDGAGAAYPDTLVGADSHTPMINGLGVLGWGVGGIEAEAAMLGQSLSLLLPRVVGIELTGALPAGATSTDLVLTVAEMLRAHGVVGKFVEFFGDGVARVPLENRATIGNMSPEYGSTCTMFPIDDETLRYLHKTGRPADVIALVEAYAKEQGLWHDPAARPVYDEKLVLDLSTVEPSLAGPTRPQDRVPLASAKPMFEASAQGDEPRWAPRSVGVASRRPLVHARRRTRGDRGDHVVHEHVEPAGDDGGGAPRAEGRRARAHRAAVGEDVARAGLARRHRLLRARRTDRTAREARLQRRRLRLHDVHRQFGAARTGDLGGHHRGRSLGGVGALRQPQLRRSHPSRLADELPRVAAARRRVRARGHDGHRSQQRSARHRKRRRARVSPRYLARRARGHRHRCEGDRHVDVPRALRDHSRRRRALARACRP